MDWCVKLTRSPAAMTEADLTSLRDLGWTDAQLSAAAFVCSYFNFINRIADGLGVDLEPWMYDHPPLPPCPW